MQNTERILHSQQSDLTALKEQTVVNASARAHTHTLTAQSNWSFADNNVTTTDDHIHRMRNTLQNSSYLSWILVLREKEKNTHKKKQEPNTRDVR